MKLLTCDDDQMPRSWAPLFQKAVKVYLVLSIPLAIIFCCSRSVRFAAAQAIATGAESIIPVKRIFCGDRYTRDGGVWGWRIAANPLGTLNLAGDNLTTWQITEQVRQALEHAPTAIYLTAGRFDLDAPEYDETKTIEQLKELMRLANDQGTLVVITLAPYGSSSEKNAQLVSLNTRIEKEFEQATILNINNTIAPQGTLLNNYTTDGSTLNEKAYDVWAGQIKASMAGGDAYRPSAPKGGVKRR